jgi:hypothetical protein
MAGTSRGRIVATIVSMSVISAYVFVTLLFVTPPNPVKAAFSDVTAAASPYFSQKWNIFAPNIAKTNSQLRVQAQWRNENGDLVESDWASITALEFRAVEGSALPSRIQNLSWTALDGYLARFVVLTGDQRALVQDTFIERYDGGFHSKPAEQLADQLSSLSDNREQVVELLRYDAMITEYATYFAAAAFDEKIERVRWEVFTEQPNDFARRFDDAEQYQPRMTRFGWRQAHEILRMDTLAQFDDVIARYGAHP